MRLKREIVQSWTTPELLTLDGDSFIFLLTVCFCRMLLSLAPFYVKGIGELAQKLLEPLGSAVGFLNALLARQT